MVARDGSVGLSVSLAWSIWSNTWVSFTPPVRASRNASYIAVSAFFHASTAARVLSISRSCSSLGTQVGRITVVIVEIPCLILTQPELLSHDETVTNRPAADQEAGTDHRRTRCRSR